MAGGSFAIFVVYQRKRIRLYVSEGELVREVKERVRERFGIDQDEAPAGVLVHDKKILFLSYAGAPLDDQWVFADVGITAGSTIKAVRREEVKPSLVIKSDFDDKLTSVYDQIDFLSADGSQLRSIVSRSVGLPVSSFRLRCVRGMEIFDCRALDEYGLTLGATVYLEVWEGWSEMLNAAMTGFYTRLTPFLSRNDEALARYQARVALYVAAHFGFVDMSVGLMRRGAKPGDPVGEHPSREWCDRAAGHRDARKAPIHEAAEAGRLEVLRAFVVADACSVFVRDADGLTPLNIALRRRHRDCASFLLARQWTKVAYSARRSLPLSLVARMRHWADRSKATTTAVQDLDRCVKQSGLRRERGALVGQGVVLDGFPPSRNLSQLTARVLEERKWWKLDGASGDPEAYFRRAAASQRDVLKLPRLKPEEKKKEKKEKEKEEEERARPGRELLSKNSEETRFPDPRIQQQLQNSSSSSSSDNPVFIIPPNKSRDQALLPKIFTHHDRNSPKFSSVSSRQGVSLETTTRLTEGHHEKTDRTNKYTAPDGSPKRKARSLPQPGGADAGAAGLHSPRFVGFSPRSVLESFENRLGLESREYAVRCLDLAVGFTEKPWLSRVSQASRIASKGIQKVFDRQQHIFQSQMSPSHAGQRTQMKAANG